MLSATEHIQPKPCINLNLNLPKNTPVRARWNASQGETGILRTVPGRYNAHSTVPDVTPTSVKDDDQRDATKEKAQATTRDSKVASRTMNQLKTLRPPVLQGWATRRLIGLARLAFFSIE